MSLLHDASALVPLVTFPDRAKRVLLRLLRVLREDRGRPQGVSSEAHLLLTDRTFLVKVLAVMKARAVLCGRTACEPEDVRVVRFLTAFRVPEVIHDQIDQIIEKAIADEAAEEQVRGVEPTLCTVWQSSSLDAQSESPPLCCQAAAERGGGGDEGGGSRQGRGGGDGEQDGGDGAAAADDGSKRSMSGAGIAGTNLFSMLDPNQDGGETAAYPLPIGDESCGEGSEGDGWNARGAPGGGFQSFERNLDRQAHRQPDTAGDATIKQLLKHLRGHIERGAATAIEDPSGMPRGWKPPLELEVFDIEPVGLTLWCERPTPALPRTTKRSLPGAAGRVAIIRDTSTSMDGVWNQWAGLVCTSVFDLAKRQKMPVGYCEFASHAQKFFAEDRGKRRFFSHAYGALAARAESAQCDGRTNYQLPLSLTLDEFEASLPRHRRRGDVSRHQGSLEATGGSAIGPLTTRDGRSSRAVDQHVLFITDGRPTVGDPTVGKEIALAQDLGVAVHTIFIGSGNGRQSYHASQNYPPILDRLSEQTGGSRFAAYFDLKSNSIRVVNRQLAR